MDSNYKNIQDLLSSSNFRVVIQKLPEVSFQTVSVKIPDISVDASIQSRYGQSIKQLGDFVRYTPLDITFKLDSEMVNYQTIKSWMEKSAPNLSGSQYTELLNSKDGLFSDIIVIIYSSAQQPILHLKFTRAFPVSLSSPIFTSTDHNDSLDANATFEFTTFEINPA
jgi:hypothetical protein